MNNVYEDDILEAPELAIEGIQIKPNMYIGTTGVEGTTHLFKEVTNNAIDECRNLKSPGTNIDIYIDEEENTVIVSDDGRGIPFDDVIDPKDGKKKLPSIELVASRLHTSTKHARNQGGGGSAGENGVGITAVNALSETFQIIVRRDGKKVTMTYREGKPVGKLKMEKNKDDNRGTTIIFKPSPKYMGKCDVDAIAMLTWLEKILCQLPAELTIKISIKRRGNKGMINKTLVNTERVPGELRKICEPATNVVHMFGRRDDLSETTVLGTFNRSMGVEIAFTYKSGDGSIVSEAFCNDVFNVKGGHHLNVTIDVIKKYLIDKTKDSLSETESKKINILQADVLYNLGIVVSLTTNLNPHFEGQTKVAVSNPYIAEAMTPLVYRVVNEYFIENPKVLKLLTSIIKVHAKSRIEVNKVKERVVKENKDIMADHIMSNFAPANNKDGEYKELYIVEGDSALGSGKAGRYSIYTQALLGLKGVPNNTFTLSTLDALVKNDFKQLVSILGCGVGPSFDISKLKYDKIIISTDADIDGHNITSITCATIAKHLPQLITEGKLYKVLPPLYKLKGKKFVKDKSEFIELFEERVSSKIGISLKGKNILSRESMKKFLLLNRNYLDDLRRLSKHYSVHPDIIEKVVYNISTNSLDRISEDFKEITLDGEILVGIYDGAYQILVIDKIFKKRIMGLMDTIFNLNDGELYYNVFNITEERDIASKVGKLTIGQLLELCQKFQPTILTRFKGLGELNPSDLKDTTMNPNNRILIQLTMNDVEDTLAKFAILHGDSKQDKLYRKNMMDGIKLTRDELDN